MWCKNWIGQSRILWNSRLWLQQHSSLRYLDQAERKSDFSGIACVPRMTGAMGGFRGFLCTHQEMNVTVIYRWTLCSFEPRSMKGRINLEAKKLFLASFLHLGAVRYFRVVFNLFRLSCLQEQRSAGRVRENADHIIPCVCALLVGEQIRF